MNDGILFGYEGSYKPDDIYKIKTLPKVLVISHGGIKGFYELGYLCVLYERGIMSELDTYIGESVGSIISLLLICGYTPKEVVNIALISEMLTMACIGSMVEAWLNKGILSLDRIQYTLTHYVKQKFLHIPTYKTLFEITGKTLCTVSLALSGTSYKTTYFNPIDTPDVSCVEGVLLSVIIPFIIESRRFEGHMHIDGAIGNPYPVDQYDDGETSILGISVTTKYLEMEDDVHIMNQVVNRIIHLYQLFDAFTECHKNRIISNCSNKVIHMNIEDDTLDFTGLTKNLKDKSKMIHKGVMCAEDDLAKIKWISNGVESLVRKRPRDRVCNRKVKRSRRDSL